MTVSNRTQRPIIDPTKCRACGICTRDCPAETQTDYRGDIQTMRGFIYQHNQLGSPRSIPPCRQACPLGQNIKEYIDFIRLGKVKEALLTIRATNPLPGLCAYVCHHPCENACTRSGLDDAIAIRNLKRFAVQYEASNQKEILKALLAQKSTANQQKIIVIGAGPAGLTCAYTLIMAGYRVEVLDALPEPGGMPIGVIPEYRLPRWVVRQDVSMIRDLGVEFVNSFQIGKDAGLPELFSRGADAVVIATGTWKDSKMMIPGEGNDGSVACIDFLSALKTGRPSGVPNRVVIIGGGNAAIDTARCVKHLGSREVTIVYRRTYQEMPAIPSEIRAAEKEGIKIVSMAAPTRILLENGKVAGLRLLDTMPGDPDESGRKRPIFLEDSDFTIPADLVISAIGQYADLSFLHDCNKISCETNGMLKGLHNVFAAGDVLTGPTTVAHSMASGKQAALRVIQHLEESKCQTINALG